MDLLHFLEQKLNFIQNLYDSTAPGFQERKRQIDAGEPPYVDGRDPEYADEPAFLPEWEEADDSLMVIGHWCLCMVQASLKTYLRDCVGPSGSTWWNSKRLQEEVDRKKGKGWFDNYRLLFLDLGIDWEKAPIALSDLEQLNLTRNDLTHNLDMFSFNAERTKEHAKRFPDGLFTDNFWPERLRVDRDRLVLAIGFVRDFCRWLDYTRCRYPQYIKTVAHENARAAEILKKLIALGRVRLTPDDMQPHKA